MGDIHGTGAIHHLRLTGEPMGHVLALTCQSASVPASDGGA